MLKITRVSEGGTESLRVEGKVLGPWVGELAQACAAPAEGLRLDLSAVTFVDDDGAALLRQLLERGAAVSACSGYVAALLRWRQP
jgi:hypothetical protein